MLDPVFEGTSSVLTATVKNESGAAIPGGSLATMVATLYDVTTGAIINGKEDVNVKALVDGAGLLTWSLTAADNPVLDQSLGEELHAVLLEWTFSAAGSGKAVLYFYVRNLAKVP